ncbi:hypothetical protein EsH8_V_001081 [Colletotrichum jinshuiense]
MADSRNMETFGTREEDWPEVDVDSDTEEGAEAMRRADAAMHATIERSIQQRHQRSAHDTIPQALYDKAENHQDQLTEEERRLLLSRGDVVGKALANPDSLTADEMHQVLLWPPPDVVRANIQRATGGRLSTPSELYAKAKDAMDRGQLETMLNENEITLLARSFHAIDDGNFSAGPRMGAFGAPGTGQAMALLSNRLGLDLAVFRAAALRQVRQMQQMQQMAPAFPGPGPGFANVPSFPTPGLGFAPVAAPQGQFGQGQQPINNIIGAMSSLHQQLELGNVTEEEAAARNREYLAALQTASSQSRLAYPAPPMMAPTGFSGFPSTLPFQPVPWPAAPPPPSRNDLYGSGPWPPAAKPRDPIGLFRDHSNLSGFNVMPGWSALPEDQKEAYRARSEMLRREAWTAHETALAEGTSPFALPRREERGQQQPRPGNLAGLQSGGERMPGVPGMPTIITGLKVFRDELGAGMEFQEVLRRWEALAEGQREAYAARAAAANAAARSAYRQGRSF